MMTEMSDLLPSSMRHFSHTSPSSDLKAKKYPAVAISLFLVIFVPYLHIGVFYLKLWVPDKLPVDRKSCICSCFDTIFKGSYEKPGNTGYKHVYFNATQNTLIIWTVTAVFVVMFYESLKYLIGLYQTNQIHFSWLALYLANIYPNYYSWWMLFGYYNDEFYPFLSHQIYFCITELLVTALVLGLCSKDSEPRVWKILMVLAISLVHVMVSSLDQFITNVIMGEGKAFQSSRDFGLMIPDLFHLGVASTWYVKVAVLTRDRQLDTGRSFEGSRQRDMMLLAGVVIFLIGLSRLL